MSVALSMCGQVTVQIGLNYIGISTVTNSASLPPDPNGCIGPTRYMEFVNGAIAVYNRTNGVSVQRKSDLKFWADAHLIIANGWDVSDPRVIYDPNSQRWFASQVDYDYNLAAGGGDPTSEQNDFLLAVSTTSDPTKPWTGFLFQSDPDNGFFADFPTLGVDSNAVYLAGDFYSNSVPMGTGLLSIPKADLLLATPTIANLTWYGVMDISNRGQVLQPATCFDGSESGSALAMGDVGTTSDFYSNVVWSAVQNAASTTNATLSAPVSLTVNPYDVPDNDILGVPAFAAPQPDDAQHYGVPTLQCNDARISARVYAVGGVLFACHTTELNGRMAVRWYRIRASDHTLLEQGTIADPVRDLFMPSIAANSNGIVLICCNGSSANADDFVSCYAYAGQTLNGQTLNGQTTFGSAILLKAGVVNYHDLNEILVELLTDTPYISRWGDYSTISVDPNDPTQFWCENLFPSGIDTSSGFDDSIWSTEVTQLTITVPGPRLAIATAGTNVLASWPLSASNYQLQSTTNLAAGAGWLPVAQTPSTNGNTISVTVSKSGRQAFFRLKLGP